MIIKLNNKTKEQKAERKGFIRTLTPVVLVAAIGVYAAGAGFNVIANYPSRVMHGAIESTEPFIEATGIEVRDNVKAPPVFDGVYSHLEWVREKLSERK